MKPHSHCSLPGAFPCPLPRPAATSHCLPLKNLPPHSALPAGIPPLFPLALLLFAFLGGKSKSHSLLTARMGACGIHVQAKRQRPKQVHDATSWPGAPHPNLSATSVPRPQCSHTRSFGHSLLYWTRADCTWQVSASRTAARGAEVCESRQAARCEAASDCVPGWCCCVNKSGFI